MPGELKGYRRTELDGLKFALLALMRKKPPEEQKIWAIEIREMLRPIAGE